MSAAPGIELEERVDIAAQCIYDFATGVRPLDVLRTNVVYLYYDAGCEDHVTVARDSPYFNVIDVVPPLASDEAEEVCAKRRRLS